MSLANIEGKLTPEEMENIMAGSSCAQFMHRGDYSRSDACIICSGLGGMAAGAIFGGPAGALSGWIGGCVSGMFTC